MTGEAYGLIELESQAMATFIKRFLRDDSGATAIEYGLIASLISIGIISAATTLGKNVSNTFTKVGSQMTSTK
jgi:pilus assembly protein Flp/PilA